MVGCVLQLFLLFFLYCLFWEVKNDSVCLSASVVDTVQMCCLVAYECCCSGTCSTDREGFRPLVKSWIFFSRYFVPVCSDCRHLSQWPPPETDIYLQSLLHRHLGLFYDSRFKLTPSELCELSAFSSKTAARVLKKQLSASTFSLMFHKHNYIHCGSLLWWHFSALLRFLWVQQYHFSFFTIYLHWWARTTTWTTVSPINLHVFLSDNAECRKNFNNLRHHAGLFGVNCSSQKQQASLISQDPLQSILWKRQWLGHLYSMRTLTLSEKMNITKKS